jgi:hypothetical protein
MEAMMMRATAWAIGAECARAAWIAASADDRAKSAEWEPSVSDYDYLSAEMPMSDIAVLETALAYAEAHPDDLAAPSVAECEDFIALAHGYRASFARGYIDELATLRERAEDAAVESAETEAR